MKNILLLGAGRSASSLIRYLAENATNHQWNVSIADAQKELVLNKIKPYPHLKALAIDIADTQSSQKLIAEQDIIISLLPPALHTKVAHWCLELGKNLLTASYVSPEMQALHQAVKEKGLLFLNEIGLDPGIDHLSAMKIIDHIRQQGGKITSFKSFTGGLIAPESDNNPWNYKFTWNPQNVVLAGQGVAKYLDEGQIKYIPYQQLFKRIENFEVQGFGSFEGYANRDSLGYQQVYGLENIRTLLRGTLRKKGYCSAWDCFVQLGMTDNQTLLPTQKLTNKAFLETFLPAKNLSVQENFLDTLQIKPENRADILEKFNFLEFFEEKPITFPKEQATPAQILQHILEAKWVLAPEDKDMIVMQHIIEYESNHIQKRIISELVVLGEDSLHTAMARTVGLPLGIACKLVLEGKIKEKGVVVPISKEFYEPILEELASLGIVFREFEEK
jgi:saccharopine dehydrogenase-like NADP-dependent oxidoreductase